ncbi:hypothetical protein DXG01_007584 [Tephrocybe rancida]|nr:hypothetical protein DXG01_007584 [Tephrocybe rancida]
MLPLRPYQRNPESPKRRSSSPPTRTSPPKRKHTGTPPASFGNVPIIAPSQCPPASPASRCEARGSACKEVLGAREGVEERYGIERYEYRYR